VVISSIKNITNNVVIPSTVHRAYNATNTTIIHYRNCADIASIQANLTQKTTNFTGLIYTHPFSNFPEDVLHRYLLNFSFNQPQLKDIGGNISEAAIELSSMRSSYKFSTITGNNMTVVPVCGKFGVQTTWEQYTTAIFLDGDQCQFPTNDVKLSKDFLNDSIKKKQKRYLKKVLISTDSFHNYWHSMIFIEAMCRFKDDPDLHFLVTTNTIPKWIKNFANAYGVSVVNHDQPILAKEIMTSSSRGLYDEEGGSYHIRDYTCSRDHFAADVGEQDSILFILRPGNDLKRNIPKSIHDKLVNATSKAIPLLKVVTFDGSETFDETIEKFQRAKIVVGPHGAGMVNLVFSKEGTQVIEYSTPTILRPWEFFCVATIGMEWWPVMLSSFRAESEILRSVAIIKEAANRI